MDEEWYVINSLPKFVDTMRAFVFNSFGNHKKIDEDILDEAYSSIKEEEREECDNVLSHEESMMIVKSLIKRQINKKTNQKRYTLSYEIVVSIIESLNDRMISNMLNKLVNRGLIETAFDSDSNDFIFWVKQNEENQEAPETD